MIEKALKNTDPAVASRAEDLLEQKHIILKQIFSDKTHVLITPFETTKIIDDSLYGHIGAQRYFDTLSGTLFTPNLNPIVAQTYNQLYDKYN